MLEHFFSRRNALLMAMSLALPTQSFSQEVVMRVRFTFAGEDFTATLDQTAAARELLDMLPLDVQIEDYSTNEKVAYLPSKLSDDGSRSFGNETPGDLCYYAPWGNLALFHGPYKWSRGLVRLGRLDAGIQPLLVRGVHMLRVDTTTS